MFERGFRQRPGRASGGTHAHLWKNLVFARPGWGRKFFSRFVISFPKLAESALGNARSSGKFCFPRTLRHIQTAEAHTESTRALPASQLTSNAPGGAHPPVCRTGLALYVVEYLLHRLVRNRSHCRWIASLPHLIVRSPLLVLPLQVLGRVPGSLRSRPRSGFDLPQASLASRFGIISNPAIHARQLGPILHGCFFPRGK